MRYSLFILSTVILLGIWVRVVTRIRSPLIVAHDFYWDTQPKLPYISSTALTVSQAVQTLFPSATPLSLPLQLFATVHVGMQSATSSRYVFRRQLSILFLRISKLVSMWTTEALATTKITTPKLTAGKLQETQLSSKTSLSFGGPHSQVKFSSLQLSDTKPCPHARDDIRRRTMMQIPS